MLFLRLADVEWLEESDGCVVLHVGKETYPLPGTFGTVAAKLPCDRFLRIAPSTLVNVQHIKKVQRTAHGQCVVVLRDGTRLTSMQRCPFS